MPTFKWLCLKNLRSSTLGQIQNLVPHRLMSRLESKTPPGSPDARGNEFTLLPCCVRSVAGPRLKILKVRPALPPRSYVAL
jgi:hypothetical protein